MSLIAVAAAATARQDRILTECESVLTYGADPTGVANSTAAFAAAIAAAGVGGAVCVPRGDYLVDPDAFDWGQRIWLGELAHSSAGTRIIASGAGTNLCQATGTIEIWNMEFDGTAGRIVQDTVHLDGADDSLLVNVIGTNASEHGFHFVDSRQVVGILVIGRLTTLSGIYWERCISQCYLALADRTDGIGLEIEGSGAADDDSFVSLFGCGTELCAGPAVYVNQMLAGQIQGAYLEGDGDHLIVDGGTTGFTFQSIRCIGGAPPFIAVRVLDASGCVFTGITASGNPSSAFSRFLIEGPSAQNQFLGNFFASGVLVQAMPCEFFDGVGSYEATGAGRFFVGTTAPTRGNWIQGDIVFNTTGTPGSDLLWRCIASGAPGTWEAIAA